jgi:hypothetical protein
MDEDDVRKFRIIKKSTGLDWVHFMRLVVDVFTPVRSAEDVIVIRDRMEELHDKE